MAYGVVHQFPGATKEQYEASIAAVHPSDGSLPEGQIFHVAGPSADGWTIVAVHDSQESWERFRNEIGGPPALTPRTHSSREHRNKRTRCSSGFTDGACRDRTGDLRLAKPALSQLS